MLRASRALSLLLFTAMTSSGCVTMFEHTADPSFFSDATNDASLRAFYDERAALIDQKFMAPVFHGNIATWFSPTKAKFADNTVYLGNVVAWRALMTGGPLAANTFSQIAEISRHISQDLSPSTTLPDGTINRGFFFRDDVHETSDIVDGVEYTVASDAQGDGNEMSQDQIVHLLYGYSVAMSAARLHSTIPEAVQVQKAISQHAHEIGLRLKAYNYIVTNPNGKPVKRGSDARGFAWPIAHAISSLTGKDLDTYLEQLTVNAPGGKTATLDASGSRELFYTALDGLSAGICDLTVGTDHRDLCSRFTLRMINAIYFASGTFDVKPLYIKRMDADGDYLGAISSLLARGDKVPARYLSELKSALGTRIASTTAPALWCRENRWIFMPTVCPEAPSDTVYSYNGVDFLSFYAALRYGAPIFKNSL